MILIDIEKTSDKNQHLFIRKMPKKLATEGNFLNLIMDIYEKLTANILLNGERLDPFLIG